VAQRLFAEPRLQGTVVTPGLNQDEALRFIEQLGPNYDQTIIVSDPAALPSLLDRGQERGIRWAELNVGILTGEAVSEAQREALLRRVGKDPERLEGFVAVFGAAEVAGLIGAETRLCLLIRRLCARTPALAEALFGRLAVPSIVQYNPLSAFLETRDGEILLTARGAAPLIRYNTHDRGGLMSAEELLVRCRLQGVDLLAELRARGWGAEAYRPLPFLYVFGRGDAMTGHGANVSADPLAHVLEETSLHATHTGSFELSAVTQPAGRGALGVESS
jgi:phenylacetate-CoA ligase